uniref:Uncharacterized protein n=1 Tax=Trichinella nativa TaxID=6335 RepID=A0A0V1KIA4_9BILA
MGVPLSTCRSTGTEFDPQQPGGSLCFIYQPVKPTW